jgi:hypothetical protein
VTRPRREVLALLCFVLASAYMVQGPGVNQNAHYALVRALADGTPIVDAYRAETSDVSYVDGHYYAAKAPSLAFVNLPVYLVLDMLGIPELDSGDSPARADLTRGQIAVVWVLGLWSALLPAVVLLLLVRKIADELEPGFGLPAAATLGLATMVLPFSELLFAHSLSTALGFAAFATLWWRRSAALAGLLAGLAITTEYTLAVVALALALYALHSGIRRAGSFVAGLLAGVAPLALYNLWAFGSVTHLSYEDAVSRGGRTGHDELAANEAGFFGIRLPSPEVAGDLIFSHLGLVTVTPVIALGLLAALRLRRPEALLVVGLFLSFVVFNSGYETPFGGGAPGPRFLVPVLAFLALGIARAFRVWPLPTLALAVASALQMWAITATIPVNATYGRWDERLLDGNYTGSLAIYAGVPRAAAVVPFFLALVCAAFCVRWPLHRLDLGGALVALAAWAVVALVGSRVFVSPQLGRQDATAILLVVLAATTVVVVIVGAPAPRAALRDRVRIFTVR